MLAEETSLVRLHGFSETLAKVVRIRDGYELDLGTEACEQRLMQSVEFASYLSYRKRSSRSEGHPRPQSKPLPA